MTPTTIPWHRANHRWPQRDEISVEKDRASPMPPPQARIVRRWSFALAKDGRIWGGPSLSEMAKAKTPFR